MGCGCGVLFPSLPVHLHKRTVVLVEANKSVDDDGKAESQKGAAKKTTTKRRTHFSRRLSPQMKVNEGDANCFWSGSSEDEDGDAIHTNHPLLMPCEISTTRSVCQRTPFHPLCVGDRRKATPCLCHSTSTHRINAVFILPRTTGSPLSSSCSCPIPVL